VEDYKMKELNIETATKEELEDYRQITLGELRENEEIYRQRFPNFPSDYGGSIDDDYNGEADEYLRLNNLLLKIDEEIGRRRKEYTVDSV
jgi:hypothetical protein